MNEVQEIIQIISLGAKGIAYLAGATAKILEKSYAEMRVAKEMQLISGQEFDSFDGFVRAVKGNFAQMHIPIKSKEYPNGKTIEEIKQNLDKRGVTYHLMPDLNKEDGKVQVLVFGEHKDKYNAFLQDYFYQFLQGGKHKEEQLYEFTNKNTSLFNVPFGGKLGELEKNLNGMKINYALLPDPTPEDNLFPIAVANKDIEKLNLLMEKIGEKLTDDIASQWKYDSYLKTAKEETQKDIKDKITNYARENKGSKEIKEWEDIEKGKEFSQKKTNPNLVEISIDIPSLIENPNQSEATYHVRFPLTKNEDKLVIQVDKNDSYLQENGQSMITFLSVDKKYPIYKQTGEKIEMTGKEISDYFIDAKKRLELIKTKRLNLIKEHTKEKVLSKLYQQL